MFLKYISKIFLSQKERELRQEDLDKSIKLLSVIHKTKSSKQCFNDNITELNNYIRSLPVKRRGALIKNLYSEEVLDSEFTKNLDIKIEKSPKEIFFNFFGMNENWPLGRCLLGAFLVHFPEYPTYFIPSYMEAKATGTAKNIKKGEGLRGIITGGLEGLAVGALVSGKKLKAQEMIPYILLGAGLQFLSSVIFPWMGEKTGQYEYKNISVRNPSKNLSKTTNQNLYLDPYNKNNISGGLKI
jgi:hypothetical protein